LEERKDFYFKTKQKKIQTFIYTIDVKLPF